MKLLEEEEDTESVLKSGYDENKIDPNQDAEKESDEKDSKKKSDKKKHKKHKKDKKDKKDKHKNKH